MAHWETSAQVYPCYYRYSRQSSQLYLNDEDNKNMFRDQHSREISTVYLNKMRSVNILFYRREK